MRGRRFVKMGVVLAALLMIGGCDQQFSTTEKSTGVGTVLGAGSGALIGSAVGHPVAGTLIGAGVGGVGGYAVGRGLQSNEDAQAQTQAQVSAQQQEIESQRRQIQQLQNSDNTE
jgi:hypothetical protein